MTKQQEQDLRRRIGDLERALETAGQILGDETVVAKRRIDEARGIVRLYVTSNSHASATP